MQLVGRKSNLMNLHISCSIPIIGVCVVRIFSLTLTLITNFNWLKQMDFLHSPSAISTIQVYLNLRGKGKFHLTGLMFLGKVRG